jgi:hypothetical protein
MGLQITGPLMKMNFFYESSQCSINLADSPTIEFSVGDLQYLNGGPDILLTLGLMNHSRSCSIFSHSVTRPLRNAL